MSRLSDLASSLAIAEQLLLAELQRRFPVGAKVRVRLQSNHETPTEVEVLGYLAVGGQPKHRGCLRVRLTDDRAWETTVPWHAVLGQFRVMCRVSGGMTGTRGPVPMKLSGVEQRFDTYEEAQRAAADALRAVSPHAKALFEYWPEEVE